MSDAMPYINVRLREDGTVMFTFHNAPIGDARTALEEVTLFLDKGELVGSRIAKTTEKQQELAQGILAFGGVKTVTLWSSQLLITYNEPVTQSPENILEHETTRRALGFARRTAALGIAPRVLRAYLPDRSIAR